MVNYNITRYPDGQISLKLSSDHSTDPIIRVSSYEDLFILKSYSDAHFNYFGYYPSVTIPCLFGQLSDRRFNVDESFDLKNICQFINSCNFLQVSVFDPHSDVPEALLNNFHKLLPNDYIYRSITNIIDKEDRSQVTLVSPDAGAYKKVFKLAEQWKHPLVAANKFRDRDGNINLVVLGDVKGSNCLIVDDICLGGRTFKILAEKLREQGANKVFLYVSHAHFFNGFDLGLDHFYCTNSVKDIENDLVTQFKVV
jgi:ribose-phosphate pyrophosphokinase